MLRSAPMAFLVAAALVSGFCLASAAGPAAAAGAPGTCLIEANQTIKLSSAIEGNVTVLDLKPGDKVKAGQVVAQLDSSVERALLAAAKQVADLDLAVRKVTRSRQLAGRDVIPQTTLEEQETQVTRAQVALDRATFENRIAGFDVERLSAIVEQRIIRSPIDGVVTRIAASVGEHVEPSVPIAVIAEMLTLRADVSLAAAAYKQVQIGMRIEIRPAEPFGGTLVADVVGKDPMIDTATGSFQVVARLPNADLALPAGVKCTARLLSAS